MAVRSSRARVSQRPPPRRYDPDAVLDRPVDVLRVRLGPDFAHLDPGALLT